MILEELDKTMSYEEINSLLSSCTWHDVDFIEGDIEPDGCERLHVTVKGVEIPVEIINLKAQQTRIGKIQLHIFIDDKFQGLGIATKIYISFIHEFGGLYSGFGRVLNKGWVEFIYKRLKKEPDIEVKPVFGYKGKKIGVEAYLK